MPRSFRDRTSTTPVASLPPGYLSDIEDSGQYKRSFTLPKETFSRGDSLGALSHEYTRDYIAEGIPPRPKTCTPEPWLSLEDQTPVFKRRGSLRKLTRAIGKLRKVDRGDKVVILGSNSTVLVMDQPHRREFLSKDANGVIEWFLNLGLEQYSNRILEGRINSCTLLKMAIDGELFVCLFVYREQHLGGGGVISALIIGTLLYWCLHICYSREAREGAFSLSPSPQEEIGTSIRRNVKIRLHRSLKPRLQVGTELVRDERIN